MPRPYRILVVDDEPSNSLLLKTMLESFGHETEVAHDGDEALGKLTPHLDLIVSDIMMPEINGYELCRRIRADPGFRDLPVIMVTVLGDRDDRLRAAEAGANDFITKPVNKLDLQLRVASLLRMKEEQDAIKRHKRTQD
ncbi:MAG: response regulator [Desulfomonilaceae bacterium]